MEKIATVSDKGRIHLVLETDNETKCIQSFKQYTWLGAFIARLFQFGTKMEINGKVHIVSQDGMKQLKKAYSIPENENVILYLDKHKNDIVEKLKNTPKIFIEPGVLSKEKKGRLQHQFFQELLKEPCNLGIIEKCLRRGVDPNQTFFIYEKAVKRHQVKPVPVFSNQSIEEVLKQENKNRGSWENRLQYYTEYTPISWAAKKSENSLIALLEKYKDPESTVVYRKWHFEDSSQTGFQSYKENEEVLDKGMFTPQKIKRRNPYSATATKNLVEALQNRLSKYREAATLEYLDQGADYNQTVYYVKDKPAIFKLTKEKLVDKGEIVESTILQIARQHYQNAYDIMNRYEPVVVPQQSK